MVPAEGPGLGGRGKEAWVPPGVVQHPALDRVRSENRGNGWPAENNSIAEARQRGVHLWSPNDWELRREDEDFKASFGYVGN